MALWSRFRIDINKISGSKESPMSESRIQVLTFRLGFHSFLFFLRREGGGRGRNDIPQLTGSHLRGRRVTFPWLILWHKCVDFLLPYEGCSNETRNEIFQPRQNAKTHGLCEESGAHPLSATLWAGLDAVPRAHSAGAESTWCGTFSDYMYWTRKNKASTGVHTHMYALTIISCVNRIFSKLGTFQRTFAASFIHICKLSGGWKHAVPCKKTTKTENAILNAV